MYYLGLKEFFFLQHSRQKDKTVTVNHVQSLTERQKLGLYSLADIQRLSGYSSTQIWRLANTGKIPSPTHPFGRKLFYASTELEGVLRAIKDSRSESLST
jgi:hypothetical protein